MGALAKQARLQPQELTDLEVEVEEQGNQVINLQKKAVAELLLFQPD